eukprot:SAG31_NODE_1051_length_10157_cov_203.009048_10_plen_248_part_00
MSGWYPGEGFYRQCSSSQAISKQPPAAQRIGWVCFALSEVPAESYCACILLCQAALDPSGTSSGGYLDGRSCFDSWGSGTDYCTWHERDDHGNVIGVLCGGCTASEEPGALFGSHDYLGCPMDSEYPSRVTYLYLHYCGLEGSLPWSLLGQLTRLQVLVLGSNTDLTGTALAEDGLAALTQLRHLDLFYSTQLSGTVPAAALGDLAQLRTLDLRSTQVDAAQCESFCDAHASTVSVYCGSTVRDYCG